MKRCFRVLMMIMLILSLGAVSVGVSPTEAAQAPRLNLKKLNLTKTTTYTIRVYNLSDGESASYKSSKTDNVTIKSVAKNTKSAVIYGKSTGSSTITVTVKKGKKTVKSLTCKVKVTPKPISIKFMDSSITMEEGEQMYLEPIIKPCTATEQPIFVSSKEDIVTVSATGLATAEDVGTATITATLLTLGKSAKCKIKVIESKDD